MRLGWRSTRVDSLKLVNCRRVENANRVRKKIFLFIMWPLYVQLPSRKNRYGLVCAIMINPPELPIDDEAGNEAHIASTGVRLY